MFLRVALAVACVLAAGCGGRHSGRPHARTIGSGAARVWVFEPSGRARAAVLFVHGDGDGAMSERLYKPWIDHLVRRGSVVVYPAYELSPGSARALDNLARGLRAARAETRGLPVLAIGYSRGGWLAVAAAALARRTGVTPTAVLSVFPASPEPPLPDLRRIDRRTQIELLVGDRDEVVGRVGAAQILALLELSRYPPDLIKAAVVRSHGGFVASHLSVLDTSRAARTAYWARADRLIARLSRSESAAG